MKTPRGIASVIVTGLVIALIAMTILLLLEGNFNAQKILNQYLGYDVGVDIPTERDARNQDLTGNTNTAAEKEQQEKEEFAKDNSVGAAYYYADLICILSDPTFWDEFFDEFFEGGSGNQEGEFVLHKVYGYGSEDLAQRDVEGFWDTKAFKENVKTRVNERCKGAPEAAGVNLDELLSGPKPF